MNHRELELLLRKDEAKWAENLEIAKRDAREINEQLQAFFEREQAELEALMNRTLTKFGRIKVK